MPAVDLVGLLRDLESLSVPELRVELAEVRRLRAVLDARLADIVSRLESTMSAVGSPVRAIPEVELVTHGGMTRREAGEVIRRAHLIEDAPIVGEALAAGELCSGHVDAISRGLKIAGESREMFIGLLPDLVGSASSMTVPVFADAVTKAAKSVVNDDGLSVFEDQRRSTYLRVWNDASGMVNVRGMLDPEIGSILHTRLAAQVETMFHTGDTEIPVVHHPWVDANDFRRAHALVSLVTQDHDSCTRPGGRGSSRSGGVCRSDVVVHIDLATLTSGLSASSTHRTSFGSDLPVETIRRIACDANVIPLVLNGAGQPLDIGRSQRLASAAQRRALEAAHDTCAFDGCPVAFHACQIHHIDYWEHGGPTDLDNMVPLCSRHHHAAHEGGWTLRLEPGSRTLRVQPPGSSP